MTADSQQIFSCRIHRDDQEIAIQNDRARNQAVDDVFGEWPVVTGRRRRAALGGQRPPGLTIVVCWT